MNRRINKILELMKDEDPKEVKKVLESLIKCCDSEKDKLEVRRICEKLKL